MINISSIGLHISALIIVTSEKRGIFIDTGLTDRLHLIHLIHEVPLPQVDGELRGATRRIKPHVRCSVYQAAVLLQMCLRRVNRCDATGGTPLPLTFPLGLAFLKTLK